MKHRRPLGGPSKVETLEEAGLDGEDVPVEDFVEHDTSRISVWKLVALPADAGEARESAGDAGKA